VAGLAFTYKGFIDNITNPDRILTIIVIIAIVFIVIILIGLSRDVGKKLEKVAEIMVSEDGQIAAMWLAFCALLVMALILVVVVLYLASPRI
jgi:hypothetical protein